MSLKAVHLFFVTALSALTLGCGIWFLKMYFEAKDNRGDLVLGVLSIVAFGAVLVYGKYFLKKLKKVSYL